MSGGKNATKNRRQVLARAAMSIAASSAAKRLLTAARKVWNRKAPAADRRNGVAVSAIRKHRPITVALEAGFDNGRAPSLNGLERFCGYSRHRAVTVVIYPVSRGLGAQASSAGSRGGSDSAAVSAGMARFSDNHAPRSINRQRSLQNGRKGDAFQSISRLQVGHLTSGLIAVPGRFQRQELRMNVTSVSVCVGRVVSPFHCRKRTLHR